VRLFDVALKVALILFFYLLLSIVLRGG